jgi:vacuolar-type H+-ATPase subunit H
MALDTEHKTSAELQREIELQRTRVESTIDQIQEKLSPGQLVDELLAYTKGGGGEFVASLQRNVTANPLPVALLGVSLAWLMARPAGATLDSSEANTIRSDRHWDDRINQRRGYQTRAADFDEYEEYPSASISGGSLQRLGNTTDEHGNTYSEFADDAGKKFRALTDATGKRAGHFVDETGNRFKGFTNAAGERIEQFRDEAGNLLDEASGWASHTWQKAREKLHDARGALGSQAEAGGSRAAQAGDAVLSQVDSLNRTIMTQFRDQPLVGGALAFALGAALGSALPHTPQEDAILGDAADALKEKVGETASELYEQGKEKAADLYATASEKAGEIYQQAKDGVTGEDRPGAPREGYQTT